MYFKFNLDLSSMENKNEDFGKSSQSHDRKCFKIALIGPTESGKTAFI